MSSSLLRAVGWALLLSLGQGLVLAAAFTLVQRFAREQVPVLRQRLAFAAQILLLLLMIVSAAVLWRGWQPEQRMTREEAVRSFTTWNAFASRQERDLGSLEVGKQADVVVLSEDVLTCDERLIPEIRPVLTLVGGEIVSRAS